MADFGLTATGLKIKRLADIKLETEAALKAAFGDNINLLPESNLGQIVGIFSERESLIWELLEDVYNSGFPSTSEGLSLDRLLALTGVGRLGATPSRSLLTLFGTPGTVIPAGSEVSQNGNNTVIFATDQAVTIVGGVDEVQTITFDSPPDAGDFTIDFDGETTVALAWNATAADVKAALESLGNLESVDVVGDFVTGFTVTFTGNDGTTDQPLLQIASNTLEAATVAVNVQTDESKKGVPDQAQVSATATQDGPISAPAGTLSVIDTPVTGWDSVTNPLDAELGTLEETDAEARARRDDQLEKAGAAVLEAIRANVAALAGVTAVLAFENTADVPDIDGRPPHTFEIIVENGQDQDILDSIWENKPAGIDSFGTVTGTVVDSQGFNQTVRFSRPTDVTIHLELDLTVNGDFPANGVNDVKAAMVAFGEGLGIGTSVIVYPQLVAALTAIPGILDLAVRIGTAANPTLDDNIVLVANEITKWDTTRVEVNIV